MSAQGRGELATALWGCRSVATPEEARTTTLLLLPRPRRTANRPGPTRNRAGPSWVRMFLCQESLSTSTKRSRCLVAGSFAAILRSAMRHGPATSLAPAGPSGTRSVVREKIPRSLLLSLLLLTAKTNPEQPKRRRPTPGLLQRSVDLFLCHVGCRRIPSPSQSL